jgi:hypothetical protein
MSTVILDRVLLENMERRSEEPLEVRVQFRILTTKKEESKDLAALMRLCSAGDLSRMILISR